MTFPLCIQKVKIKKKKKKKKKNGRKGYFRWKDEKEKAIRPSDYGDYILQCRKRGKRK